VNTGAPRTPPEYFSLLPDREAIKHLTVAVLQGTEELPQSALAAACVPLREDSRWQTDSVRELIDEAMDRFGESPTHADAWLAPRLHTALRITRREAADPGLWNFLALRMAPEYVLWRHPGRPASEGTPGATNLRRFCGPFHTQTFARLWWAAELFRDGPDYRPVEIACGHQDVLNTVLRLDIIHHRCTAQAMIRMLADRAIRTGREVNALAIVIGTAGSTLFYEVLAPDVPPDPDAYRAWLDQAGMAYIPYDSLPEGPQDGGVPAKAVDALVPLLEKLFEEAPVRGRTVVGTGEKRVQES
jgi:hypothetical protein